MKSIPLSSVEVKTLIARHGVGPVVVLGPAPSLVGATGPVSQPFATILLSADGAEITANASSLPLQFLRRALLKLQPTLP